MNDQRPPVAPLTITRALRPQIAIFSSEDVDEIARSNGLDNLAHLLKPWESSVERVNLRTSGFVSHTVPVLPLLLQDHSELVRTELDALFLDNLTVSVDKRTHGWLQHMPTLELGDGGDHDLWREGSVDELTPWYAYYREALIERRPRTEYETFGHTVACMLAVSTSNPEPLNAFAELYDRTSPEKLYHDKPHMDPHVLRFYVLVHDLSAGPAEEWTRLLEDVRKAYGIHVAMLVLNAESARLPDSAFATPEQRPPPKDAAFPDFWRNLPTSPTVPTNRSFASAGDAQTPMASETRQATTKKNTVEPGSKLGTQDVWQIKTFLREFTVQSLVPYLERHIAQTNEQLAASRKGIAGRLFSAGRRYFGSRPASPAGSSSNQPTYDAVRGVYPYQTQEAQTRRLADLAFMMCDYRLAANLYEIARKDFLADKAWRYYASATRMAGLTNLLLSTQPGAASVDADSYLEQAASASPPENTQLDDLRAIALYYELYQMTGQWRKASAGLARSASDVEELPSALMLEQAAMAYLKKVSKPALRRSALHFAIASQRYQTSGSKALARRCGLQALSHLQGRKSAYRWRTSQAYLGHTLGRQAYNAGLYFEAVKHFVELLDAANVPNDTAEGATATSTQGLLDDLKLAYEGLMSDKTSHPTSIPDGDGTFSLPKAIFQSHRTCIRTSVGQTSQSQSGNDRGLFQQLEENFLETGYPFTDSNGNTRKRPLTLLTDSKAYLVHMGTSIDVVLLARNPINASITISDVALAFTSQDADADFVVETKARIVLGPMALKSLSLPCTMNREGKFRLSAVTYRLEGLVPCRESLTKRGPRLHATKAQLVTPTYGEDTSLDVSVENAGPILRADITRLPSGVLAGETARSHIKFHNAGVESLHSLRILCSHPSFVALAPTTIPCPSNDATLSMEKPAVIADTLAPDQYLDVQILVHGDGAGVHEIGWLCVYETGDTKSATPKALQLSHRLVVAPNLRIVPEITGQVQQAAPRLNLTIVNDSIREDLILRGIVCSSPHWSLELDDQVHRDVRLRSGQAVSLDLRAVFVPPSEAEMQAWRTIGRNIKAAFSNPDAVLHEVLHPPAKQKAVTGLKLSEVTIAQALLTHKRLRLARLKSLHPTMADNLQRAAFPLFAPDSLDVILVWECPGSGRRGHHHLVDLAFFQSGMLALDNSSTIVELPNAAAPSRDQNGKVAREQAQAAHKIESALQDPDLAPVAAPISVVQSVDAILEHPSGARSSTRQARLSLVNYGPLEVSYTLELLGPFSRQPRRSIPPVQWTGKMRFKGQLGPSDSIELKPSFVVPSGTRDVGAWTLTVTQQGASVETSKSWRILGSEKAVTAM